ncbi:MAG TPA: glutaredoxin domain-containing protein [Actinoplanes sp.]
MVRRWGPSIALLVGACAFAAFGRFLSAALFLFAAFLLSPRAFPSSVTDAQARAASARDGRPIVYWRPGCPFCLRLRVTVGRNAGRLHWVDIWADPAGAASVRGVTGGDETVPTVVTTSGSYVNPSPDVVRGLLQSPR